MAVVSVIIPCYNAEDYITKCLEALNAQSFRDFDVFLIDDCSTDHTADIIFQIQKSSTLDIKYLKNEKNSGPAYSRNAGVLASNGRYIAFCDSDDWYESDYLMRMVDAAIAEDADVVFCNSRKVSPTGDVIATDPPFSLQFPISRRDALLVGIDSLCRILLRRDIALSIPMPDLRNGEDMAVIPLMLMKAERFAVVDKPLYNYLCRPGSLSLGVSAGIVSSLETSFYYIADRAPSDFFDEIEYVGVKNLVYGALLNHFKHSADSDRARKLLCRFEERYPLWHKNKYLKRLPLYKFLFVKMAKIRFFFGVRMLSRLHQYAIGRGGQKNDQSRK